LVGASIADVLRTGRPGLMVGWRANLLGVDAPALVIEGEWPLPWLGASWSAALRGGWWRESTAVPASLGLPASLAASADVVPLSLLAFRSFTAAWARPYAGAGIGVDLVVMRVGDAGALDAGATAQLVGGAGRPLGPGELFAELAAGLGGVDGPLGRLRTGGISFSVGYRLVP
jgi:hypothetical protein